ncbi:MAG TPA: hypothetical protein ENN19_18675 [Chloroflexi bacterium]|mgnify:CR=1 FL=1|nr:hypothetical protein [Chloroflexota bacterium]
MDVHLYLSMMPEALIASMLTPKEFGVYYAVGSSKKARGQAVFCEIAPDFRHPYFDIEEGIRRCVPHEDGSPKASIYISVYRVLEHVSLDTIQKLYLATQDGRVLGLEACDTCPQDTDSLHLYQEIAPVHPLVVSSLGPVGFHDLIVKNPTTLLSLPAICFVELRLDELANDPERGAVGDLPYSNIGHLRQCLVDLRTKLVHTKMVNRVQPASFPYRTIKSGLFVGNREELVYFPMPAQETLRAEHYRWWRSANM